VEDEKARKGRDIFGRSEGETLISRALKVLEGRASEMPEQGRALETPEQRALEIPEHGRVPEMPGEGTSETMGERVLEPPEVRAVELPMKEPEGRAEWGDREISIEEAEQKTE